MQLFPVSVDLALLSDQSFGYMVKEAGPNL